jgi:hypothetical protein
MINVTTTKYTLFAAAKLAVCFGVEVWEFVEFYGGLFLENAGNIFIRKLNIRPPDYTVS